MNKPVLIVPIGPSGSGKSTLFNSLKDEYPDLYQYSWDILRHNWYDKNDYSNAWKLAQADKTFYTKAGSVFDSLVKEGKNIYLDNTNLSPKTRGIFITKAKQKKYKTIAYEFNCSEQLLIERQASRTDKTVPVEAVLRQYRSVVPPQYREFDEVRKVP